MFLTDLMNWPIYITDTDRILCGYQGCDGEMALPGRRVTLAQVVEGVERHAQEAHGTEARPSE